MAATLAIVAAFVLLLLEGPAMRRGALGAMSPGGAVGVGLDHPVQYPGRNRAAYVADSDDLVQAGDMTGGRGDAALALSVAQGHDRGSGPDRMPVPTRPG